MSSTLEKLFSMLDDTEQAAFLNETGKTCRVSWRHGAASESMQFCRIAEKLDEDGQRFVTELAEYVAEYRRKP